MKVTHELDMEDIRTIIQEHYDTNNIWNDVNVESLKVEIVDGCVQVQFEQYV